MEVSMKSKNWFCLATALTILATPALAGVTVDGSVRQITIVGSNRVEAAVLSSGKNNINAHIDGDLNQTVIVGSNTVRSAAFSKAQTDIGGVSDVVARGDLDRTISVKNVSTRARFLMTKAETKIGTLQNTIIDDDFRQTIHVGTVVTDARHFGKTAKTCIGAISGQHLGGGERSLQLGTVVTKTKQSYLRSPFGKVNLGPLFGKSRTASYGSSGC
jgi:hypothetical protein